MSGETRPLSRKPADLLGPSRQIIAENGPAERLDAAERMNDSLGRRADAGSVRGARGKPEFVQPSRRADELRPQPLAAAHEPAASI